MLKLLTHLPPQTWKPSSQAMPQVSPSQVAVPLSGAGQAVHESPQLSGELFEAQRSPQAWVPAEQAQVWFEVLQLPGWGQSKSAAQPGRHSFSALSQ